MLLFNFVHFMAERFSCYEIEKSSGAFYTAIFSIFSGHSRMVLLWVPLYARMFEILRFQKL